MNPADLPPTYTDYYTYRREDGSLMSGPSHTLIEPPMWVVAYRDEVAKIDERLDAIEAAIRDLAVALVRPQDAP